ncbi:hypothetical protein [Bradyrhizobium icense]|uniref:HEPN domain-containing protein n=1 Tax=Bradyrhizobium icense TaxID=1274631 RepID=A0A1B1UBG4_9BRAD|nr:hypothetical protein [Bradyrhizobium icense]ANW00102.1 hypothetical protein LMTR13_07795 [Bradyrhizobium icense]
MKLIRVHLEPGAMVNYIQIGHRRTAVEYAIAGIQKIHDANLDLLGRDPLSADMEGAMMAWVIESLLQGAYVREYHLWEKDCKAYFALIANRNNQLLTINQNEKPFPNFVRKVLLAFDVTLPDTILSAIDHMRKQVNVMKHEEGLELDHFVSEADYKSALDALESFWNELMSREEYA